MFFSRGTPRSGFPGTKGLLCPLFFHTYSSYMAGHIEWALGDYIGPHSLNNNRKRRLRWVSDVAKVTQHSRWWSCPGSPGPEGGCSGWEEKEVAPGHLTEPCVLFLFP